MYFNSDEGKLCKVVSEQHLPLCILIVPKLHWKLRFLLNSLHVPSLMWYNGSTTFWILMCNSSLTWKLTYLDIQTYNLLQKVPKHIINMCSYQWAWIRVFILWFNYVRGALTLLLLFILSLNDHFSRYVKKLNKLHHFIWIINYVSPFIIYFSICRNWFQLHFHIRIRFTEAASSKRCIH